MRITLFVAGLTVGLTMQAAVAQVENRGVVAPESAHRKAIDAWK